MAATAPPGGRQEQAEQDGDDGVGLLQPMVHQVGGHRAATAEEPPYMLRLRPHFVLKVVQDGPRGDRELQFYRRLFPSADNGDGNSWNGGADSGSLEFLRAFVPSFHGVRRIRSPPHLGADAPLVPYMVLEDISDRNRHQVQQRRRRRPGQGAPSPSSSVDSDFGEQRPSVIDIKMGRATHGPFASPGKAARERGKYPHQAAVGFRIIGMKVYDPAARRYETEGKAYGRGLLPEEVDDALARFFLRRCSAHSPSHNNAPAGDGDGEGGSGSRGEQRRATAGEVLDFYIARLEALHAWFQGQRAVRFWSSSLLFVDHEEKEAEPEAEEDAEEGDADAVLECADGGDASGGGWRHPVADVRMIDFAHVELRAGGETGAGAAGDENYMYGLLSLLEHLRRLRARAAALEGGGGWGVIGVCGTRQDRDK